ncbi:hypothetical protein COV19_05105 [Candidatus Woesearchaeota archaeon CG10_big_fil_rev_8_21_14_0_10_44_13]|nr:MAG: hypothetical protein COV19_05105 [Candidatus Woesearchaeota archaeon CG10_big_fil_rev_8_21_14_0_10_44_13]
MLYKPREDSHLLVKYVKRFASGRVLDIGTGSGIQAMAAAKLKRVKSVLAVDIQEEIVQHCMRHCRSEISSRKISFRQSDLFGNIAEDERFDTIIFNPPYLPEDASLKDITVEGGKKGYETLERFFDGMSSHLKPEGTAIIIFSSFTNKDKVDGFIADNLLEAKELDKRRIFFEELYVYMMKKSAFLKTLEKKGIKGIRRLTKGKRGLIFIGQSAKNRKKIAIKLQRKDIGARGTVDRESRILRLLNRKKIGPKILFSGKDFFAYEFVEGIFIPEFLEKAGKREIINILNDVFLQCRKLDMMRMNKEEMQHPYKHIVVCREGSKARAVLLDFERARKTGKPSNVTQFCQYVTSGKFRHLASGKIRIDEQRLRKIAAGYKKQQTDANFKKLLKIVAAQ